MNLGLAIKTVRKKRKIKQTAFAKQVGISQVTVSYIETGRSIPSPQNLKAIARTLNVPIPFLYVLGAASTDVDRARRSVFKEQWPKIQQMAAEIFFEDPENYE